MKSLTKTVMLFGMLLSMAAAKAQSSQAPHLFDAFSNSISINTTELEKIFALSQGSNAQLDLGSNLIFKGSVISSVQKFANLKTMLIKSSNFDAAMFSISRRVNADNSISYIGRILSGSYADGYQLVKTGSNYSLNKIKHEDILQD